MNYSHNVRAHALYTGTLRAFLEPNDGSNNSNNVNDDHLHDEILRRAASWLAQHNPYLQPFADILSCYAFKINNKTHFDLFFADFLSVI